MLIDKIQERGYVKKEDVKGKTIIVKDYELENDEISEIEATREFGNEKNKLVLQPLGKIVMEFLDKHFFISKRKNVVFCKCILIYRKRNLTLYSFNEFI